MYKPQLSLLFILLVALSAFAATPSASFYSMLDDDEKEFLSGNKEYVLHFNKEQIPPAKAMWILAAYNTDLTFAENTLKRYWLSSKDDLQYNSDGSLDIYIQNKTPGKDKESNWLPIPDKEFILVFNVYGLGKDKRSELPAVKAITNYE